ncbi:catecholate siderophore receptor [Andreprevotia lacus DSM 23236]|jgi:catecholate siderophore receptor|uniref:Catecholate siderophore receptor n=1 Tax=Andreprevotia lacus DSM 23236 TaxID=1121001 RepID=A0A1W1X9T2_9NEIS|nr:TonB-dependent siderophore receptor [Andreprevotia lacus]SMC20587.1 catecholate siderophore receptor [Andreprevotia lacus DSM 23236]
MALIKSRKHQDLPQLKHSVVALALALPATAALAADPAPAEPTLPAVQITDTAPAPYTPNKVQSPKYTEPLRDTPKTVTVLSKELIEDQNLLSLRDILSTVPGITFGAGEGGSGYGDSINIRGFAASNDITIDGMRDSAQYSRTDPFNLEQIEVTKGSSSAVNGAGSVGGNINLVSKAPRLENSNTISTGIGSDGYYRATADVNRVIGETSALRLNIMGHQNDVPGRDVENNKRWGFAPSVAFGLGTDTRYTLSYFHQSDDNIPQFGQPFRGNQVVPGTSRSQYYGFANVDTQESTTDVLTSLFEHDFGDKVKLRNQTRVSKTSQFTITDGPEGRICYAVGRAPLGTTISATNAACSAAEVSKYKPSFTPTGGSRGNVRDTVNKLLANQTDVTWNFNTGSLAHTLVTGVALTHEGYTVDSSQEFANANGTNYTIPTTDLYNPNTNYTGPRFRRLNSRVDSTVDNMAVYAFDTVKFNDHWSVNGGLRWEYNDTESTTYNVGAATAGANAGKILGAYTPAKKTDRMLSYQGGVVYKPVEEGSIYVSYSNSKTPSKATVNGTCTSVGSSTTTTGFTCSVDPETAVTYEIGTKWDVLESKKLSVNAALFRTDRTNYKVASNDPSIPDQQLDGQSRVQGIELGVSGLITKNWSVFANYSYMKSEVLQSVSNAAKAGGDPLAGDPLTNVPEHAFSLWTTYDLPQGVQLGYGATYQGSVYLNQHSATYKTGPLDKLPSYWVHRATASYKVNRNLNLRLTVNNLFDKLYYTRPRGSGWATPGDARNYVLDATYSF